MPARSVTSIATLLVVTALAPLAAQGRGQAPQAPTTAAADSTPRVETAGPAEEKISQTSHTMRLDGREIKYTATAGTLPIRLDNGQVAARMFFVAYTKDGEDAKTRPVSFLYNGGPGAATIWLHMGSFAPQARARWRPKAFSRRRRTSSWTTRTRCSTSPTWCSSTPSTPATAASVAGVDNKQFHGVRGDLRAFGEFINGYLKTYSRFPSPKYLIGESYGTIRSAGLAAGAAEPPRHRAERHHAGLVAADLPDDRRRRRRTTSPTPSHIETYTATAWYHKKLPADLPAT